LHASLLPTHLYRLWKFNFGEKKGYGSVVIVGTSWKTNWEHKKQVGDTLGRMWWECIVNLTWTHQNLDLGTCWKHQYSEIQTFPTFEEKSWAFWLPTISFHYFQECMFLTTFVTFFCLHQYPPPWPWLFIELCFCCLGWKVCKFKYHDFRHPIVCLLDTIISHDIIRKIIYFLWIQNYYYSSQIEPFKVLAKLVSSLV
jgi:hypothetical protein